MAIQHRLQTTLFGRICLALSHVANAITSWIWGVSCCMSASCIPRVVEHNGPLLAPV
jgi:hypothetical protein